jgi:periplasmic glucans biosynthesis protein
MQHFWNQLGAAALLAGWVCVSTGLFMARPAQAAAFSFDTVAREAQQLAQSPWRKPAQLQGARAAIGYDDFRRIRFRAEHAVWRDAQLPFQLQFFTTGNGLHRALRLHEVVDGQARPLVVRHAAFDYDGLLDEAPQAPAPIAGWRVTSAFNEPGKQDEVASFLGSNYFRALGQGQRYGLSARALAIDTTGAATPEEFPDFSAYWFERPKPGARELVVHALLDSPRATGAYRIVIAPGAQTATEVRARLFLRGGPSPSPGAGVGTLGIAPLTSMFLHGENQPPPNGDFRPEVHDSDGLQIHTAEGEWIWRPLTNPKGVFVTSFALTSPKGFGLMQRDRSFDRYEDIEARYDLRPSAWIEPIGDWGAGRVELLQFHTPDETHDNVVAYWVPAARPRPGAPLDIAWRVNWQKQAQSTPPGAHAQHTHSGHGYVRQPVTSERRKLVIDFAGGAALPAEQAEAVQAVASASANARIARVHTYPNPVRGGWRTTLEFDRLDPKQAVELRVFLRHQANTLSETWSYALAPE